MSGRNPYIDDVEIRPASRKFEITFVLGEDGEERKVEADPERFPYGHDGLPGSVLDVALGAGIEIDHACGGVCACSTCHVVVVEGSGTCNEPSDDELDMLDNAPGLRAESRLSCQCVPDGSAPLRVMVPSWNRNFVKEGH